MGAQYLLSRFLTPNKITEVSQYNFNMKSLTVSPKNIRLTSQKQDLKVISGLKAIEN